jgi:hypothetical protein
MQRARVEAEVVLAKENIIRHIAPGKLPKG